MRHRQVFRAQGWDQESAARVRSALHFELADNPLAIELEAHPAQQTEEGSLRVPVKLQFPLSSVALEPIDRSLRGQLSIFTIAGDARSVASTDHLETRSSPGMAADRGEFDSPSPSNSHCQGGARPENWHAPHELHHAIIR